MHGVVALNLWGNVVVNMIFWLFCKSHHYETPKLVFLSNLSLLKYVVIVLCPRFRLKNCLQTNLSKKSRTVILPQQPNKLIFINFFMLIVVPDPLCNLPSLKLPISYKYKY